MSTIDEVLAAAEVVEAVCVIDGETRIISVPNEYKELGVESDENVTRIKFQCPKIVGDNIDLTEYNLYINYRNAGNKLNSYLVEDATVTGDVINFSWLLSRHVTESPGTISYIVCAKKSDYTGVINEWNTKVATGMVGVGLEATEEIEEQNVDIIEQILRSIVELENKVDSGGSGGSGGYYAPSVDGAGNLTWTASKTDMPAVDGANIKGPRGKSAYQYAQEGGYTGTETAFAEKLAQEQLTGTTNELTPTQVYQAVSAGIPVKVQYTDSEFGVFAYTAFAITETMGVIAANTIAYYNGQYMLGELVGIISTNSWSFMKTTLAQKTDIPSALPNPNALTFSGAVTGTYDGSAALSVEIPGGGGDNPLRLIKTITLTETVKSITVDTDDDGNAFSLSEIYIITNVTNSENQTGATNIGININGKDLSGIGTTAAMSISCGKNGEVGRNWLWLMSLNPLRIFHGTWITSNISTGKPVQCYQTNELTSDHLNPYSVGEKIASINIGGVGSKSYLSAGSKFRIYGR